MLLPFFDGKGIFEILIERIIEVELKVPVILATTENPRDDVLVEIAKNKGVSVFRGSEENVLDRFIGAAEEFGAEKIIRVCADNPFLDIKSLGHLIERFGESKADYWCYALEDGTPSIKTHYGFWAEGVTLTALKKAASLTQEKVYLEHVTNFIYTNPGFFAVYKETIPPELEKNIMRLTIDTAKDFEVSKEIYSKAKTLKASFNSLSLSEFILIEPTWIRAMQEEINQNKK